MNIIPVVVFLLLPVSQSEDIDCSLEYSSRCKQAMPKSTDRSHKLGHWCPKEGDYLTCMWSYEENCDDGHDLNSKRDLHQRKMSILTDMCDPESQLHKGITNNMGCIRRAYKSIANCRNANNYDDDSDDNDNYYVDNDDYYVDNDDYYVDNDDDDEWSAFSFLDSEDYEHDDEENTNFNTDIDNIFGLVDDEGDKKDVDYSYSWLNSPDKSDDDDDDNESENTDSDGGDDEVDDYDYSEMSAKTEIFKKLLNIILKSTNKKSDSGKRFSMSKAEFACLVRQVREDCGSNVEEILMELQNRLHTKFFPPQKEPEVFEDYEDEEDRDIISDDSENDYQENGGNDENGEDNEVERHPQKKKAEDFEDFEDYDDNEVGEESAINSAHYVYTENDYLKNDVGSGYNGDAQAAHDAESYRKKNQRYYIH